MPLFGCPLVVVILVSALVMVMYPCVIEIGTPKPSLKLGQNSQSAGKLLAVLAGAVSWTFITCPNFDEKVDVPISMTHGYQVHPF